MSLVLSLFPSLDDAVRMCTNISSVEVVQHMQLCHRILPRDWQSEEASVLCEGTTGRAQVEAAVKCAVDAVRFAFPSMSRLDAARLCAGETVSGSVFACAKEVSRTPSSNPGAGYIITPKTLVDTCARTADKAPGACLARLTTYSSQKFIFDAAVPARLCRLPEPLAVIACLEGTRRHMVTVDDVDLCLSEQRVLTSLRVTKMLTEDNDVEVTAGRRFLLWFDLFDQWGGRFLDPRREVMFSASINGNNPQGAVMWGLRSNYSSNGVLQLNSLVISQPGAVEFKVSFRDVSGSAQTEGGPTAEYQRKDLQHLQVFRLAVKEDPVVANASPCVYVFQHATCPVEVPAADWEAEFPRIRSYTPPRRYAQNIDCAASVGVWHVDAWLGLDGSMWVEYRLGVDAIWTGVGMPRMEMSFPERLDLPSNITAASTASYSINGAGGDNQKRRRGGKSSPRKTEKEALRTLKRAYYRKSLQWHPDRWAGMPMYATAVQGAFELVNEAYTALGLQMAPPGDEGGGDSHAEL